MNASARKPPLVLVCPLNWGLGHASRCVPLIRAFLDAGCRVVVAAEGFPLRFLQQVFGREVEYEELTGVQITYPSGHQMFFRMLRLLPTLLRSIWVEHRRIQHLVKRKVASIVISDNRYGLFTRSAKCVLITHQLFFLMPPAWRMLQGPVRSLIHWFVRRFDHCWIPDEAGPNNLSGLLSHERPFTDVRFIGPLSRFYGIPERAYRNPFKGDFPQGFYLVMLSGPEPQRSMLEHLLREAFAGLEWPVVFVRGRPGVGAAQTTSLPKTDCQKANICSLNHAADEELAYLISRARLVVCRPGYSSIMDLSAFGKKALVIPTPGQTEQEYLGLHMAGKGWVYCTSQDDIRLREQLALAESLAGIPRLTPRKDLLQQALREILNGGS